MTVSGVFPAITNAEVSAYEDRISGGTWIQDSSTGRWWYKHADGTYTSNDWEYINGKWYWFDASGVMVTGNKRISGIDYYFNSSGVLKYDASLAAAIYTKNYGANDINTLLDGDMVARLVRDYYKIEQYDNFTKSSFTSSNNRFKTNNLN